jgi:hypothetical protein
MIDVLQEVKEKEGSQPAIGFDYFSKGKEDKIIGDAR